MRSEVFNSTFENMLRILLLLDVVGEPINVDRVAALDFICIFGKKFEVLDKNLHGDNDFGFAEFAHKREKVVDATKLAVKNDYVSVIQDKQGFRYIISNRGKSIVENVQSPYSRAYMLGAKIVHRRFSNYTDDALLKFISGKSKESMEV